MAGSYLVSPVSRSPRDIDLRGFEACWEIADKMAPVPLPHIHPTDQLHVSFQLDSSMSHGMPLHRHSTFPTHLNTSGLPWDQQLVSPILRSSPQTWPISPPASVVPQLISPTLDASTRQTSPSTSEASSRRESCFIHHMDRSIDQMTPVLPIDTRHAHLVATAQYTFNHPYQVHGPYAMPIINGNVVMQDISPVYDSQPQHHTPAFDFEPAHQLSSTYENQAQVPQPVAEASDESTIDAEGDIEDADTMELDEVDNDDTLSESSTKDAEGEDADDSDYTPIKDSNKKKQSPQRSRRRSAHSRTNSQSSHPGDTPGPIRTKKNRTKNKKRVNNATARAFPCPLKPFGCAESFDAKNEWKRHINTQHVPTHTYRCEICLRDRRVDRPYRQMAFDFKRKDLFTMHLKRMHYSHYKIDQPPPNNTGRKGLKNKDSEKTVKVCNDVAARCEIEIRKPPQDAGCILCEKQFSGPQCWEARTDHIANDHFESLRREGQSVPDTIDWEHDELMQEWFEGEGIIVKDNGEWRLTI